MTMLNPVLIAAGGTGGHIFPALAVAEVLREQEVPVVWVGTHAGLEARLVPEAGFDVSWISVAGVRGTGWLRRLTAPLQVARAVAQSVALLLRMKPRAVLGMGGFVSGPMGIAATLMRCPLVLHEQNAIAGLTNRWLSRVATAVLSAMPGAFPERVQDRVVGNPLRQSIEAVGQSGGLAAASSASLRVLVVGGSRGARVLNETVPVAVRALMSGSDEERLAVQVRHQTGQSDEASVRDAYQGMAGVTVQAFVDDMTEAYSWADVVVCRAGAMTVAELAAMGRASILVPYPYAVDDHQLHNARWLVDRGAAVLIPQTQFSAERLTDTLRQLGAAPQEVARMAQAAQQRFQPNAATQVASTVLNAARRGLSHEVSA